MNKTDVILRCSTGLALTVLAIVCSCAPSTPVTLKPKGVYHEKPAVIGPHVPIPTIPAATIIKGRGIYLREGCDSCHTLRDSNFWSGGILGGSNGSIPDLTHEGQRHASVTWHITNLRDHSRVFPNGWMSNYDNLTPGDLRALASYMATRR